MSYVFANPLFPSSFCLKGCRLDCVRNWRGPTEIWLIGSSAASADSDEWSVEAYTLPAPMLDVFLRSVEFGDAGIC